MACKSGKTVATLLVGAALGAVAGYFIGTDEEKREEHLNKVKHEFEDIKTQTRKNYNQLKDKITDKFGTKTTDIQEDIYNDDAVEG